MTDTPRELVARADMPVWERCCRAIAEARDDDIKGDEWHHYDVEVGAMLSVLADPTEAMAEAGFWRGLHSNEVGSNLVALGYMAMIQHIREGGA